MKLLLPSSMCDFYPRNYMYIWQKFPVFCTLFESLWVFLCIDKKYMYKQKYSLWFDVNILTFEFEFLRHCSASPFLRNKSSDSFLRNLPGFFCNAYLIFIWKGLHNAQYSAQCLVISAWYFCSDLGDPKRVKFLAKINHQKFGYCNRTFKVNFLGQKNHLKILI